MIYIGIDPDIDRSGVAVYDTVKQTIELKTLRFADLIEEIVIASYLVPIHIVVEGGWLINKSNWHNEKQGSRVASRIGKNVGMNHATGLILVQMIEKFADEKQPITLEVVKPRGKLKNEIIQEMFKNLPKKQTNQEERDALMLISNFIL